MTINDRFACGSTFFILLAIYTGGSNAKPANYDDTFSNPPLVSYDKNAIRVALLQDPTTENTRPFEENKSATSSILQRQEYAEGPRSTSRNSWNSALTSGIIEPEIKFLETTHVRETSLPEYTSEKASVPIVAVINTPIVENGNVEGSLIAILPSQSTILKEQDQSFSMPIDGVSNKSDKDGDVDLPNIILATETSLTQLKNKDVGYSNDSDDMDVAEDIIFRPLFRKQHRTDQKTDYRNDENIYKRFGYRRYNPYRVYNPNTRITSRYRPRYFDNYYK
ncbi:hypothetical protein KM043_017486 [Ampulex compressa]|nr:hypothetical protein KM043_017486 [Ampulex compressa]